MKKNYKCINSFTLKMIAIITMVIDHVSSTVSDEHDISLYWKNFIPIVCVFTCGGKYLYQ